MDLNNDSIMDRIASLAESAGYTVESDPESSATFQHSSKLGGVTIRFNLITRQYTATLDGLGKRLEWDTRWRHYKLKRRNVTLEGLEAMLDNPFRGTFCEPLEDGWVEHGNRIHRHTDQNQHPEFFHIFLMNMMNLEVDLGLLAQLNLNDDIENDDDIENNNDVEDQPILDLPVDEAPLPMMRGFPLLNRIALHNPKIKTTTLIIVTNCSRLLLH